MHKLITTAALISVVLIAGCATSSGGIVEIGTDTYKVGSAGRFADYSSSAIKSRLYEDAYRHCAAKNRLMVPVNPGSAEASNELQFRCLARNEARVPSAPAPTL
ncbi:MAG: hypothetical protein ACXW16_04610 [Burkholderiaceae bacterium]